jgi:ATP-binding cassette subfamily B protein
MNKKPLWYIWRLARYRIGLYIVSALFSGILFYCFPLLPGLIAQYIFDHLMPNNQHVIFSVWLFIGLLIGVAIARFFSILLARTAQITLVLTIQALLRLNIFNHILQQPGADALFSSAGETLSRLRNDVGWVSDFVCWVFDPCGQLLVLVVALIILFLNSPLITLTVFCPVLIALSLINVLRRRIQHYRRANQEAIGEVTSLLSDIFTAALLLKYFHAEQRATHRLEHANSALRKAALRDTAIGQAMELSSVSMTDIGTGILLLISAFVWAHNQLSLGNLALFMSYLGWLTSLVSQSGGLFSRYHQMCVSLDRLLQMFSAESSPLLVKSSPVYLKGPLPDLTLVQKTAADVLRVFSVQELCYHYDGSEHGIENISFSLQRGTLTVITGRIGSGKTTLLRVLTGLLPKEKGIITWNGEVIEQLSNILTPPRLAYTSQVPHLFSQTLKENILLGLPEHSVDLSQALHTAVLESDLTYLENRLETKIGPRGTRLSGGQIQRAALARMLVRQAELLVIDDVSNALDVETEEILWRRVLASEQQTYLVVSHRRSLLAQAQQILLLKDGKLEAQGNLTTLLETNEEMQALWHSAL